MDFNQIWPEASLGESNHIFTNEYGATPGASRGRSPKGKLRNFALKSKNVYFLKIRKYFVHICISEKCRKLGDQYYGHRVKGEGHRHVGGPKMPIFLKTLNNLYNMDIGKF